MIAPLSLSVVVPALNEGETLSQCLASLAEQDWDGPYEIIVVDNGSTDDTVAVARSHGVRVIHCPERGVALARAAGAREAQGAIVVQADADTVYPSGWLRALSRHFAASPGLVAVAGEVNYEAPPFWARVSHLFRRVLNQVAWRLLGRPVLILACNFAARKDALERCGGYNLGLPHIGDEHDLLRRIGRVGAICYDPTITARTSSRRFTGRFLQFVFVDFLVHAVLAQVMWSWFKRPVPLHRPVVRHHGVLGRPLLQWAPSLAGLAALLGVLSYGYFYPPAQVFGKTYRQLSYGPHPVGVVPERVVALTFDDGPNEPYTSQVLDILDAYQAPATFFLIGANVDYYPAVVQRMAGEGHAIGNHSYSHSATADVTQWSYREFDRAQEAIYNAAGVYPALFRPPYGQKTPWQLASVRKKGAATIMWSVSANDPHAKSAAAIARSIISKAKAGSIILLHDGVGTIHGGDRSRTVEALPIIIEELQARGYRFVTVPELLDLMPYLAPDCASSEPGPPRYQSTQAVPECSEEEQEPLPDTV